MLQFVLIMLYFSAHRMTVLCFPNCTIMLDCARIKPTPNFTYTNKKEKNHMKHDKPHSLPIKL